MRVQRSEISAVKDGIDARTGFGVGPEIPGTVVAKTSVPTKNAQQTAAAIRFIARNVIVNPFPFRFPFRPLILGVQLGECATGQCGKDT